jgi:hypothetical protein
MKQIVPLLVVLATACASTPSNVRMPVIVQEVDPYVGTNIMAGMFNGDVRIEGTVGTDGRLYDARVASHVPVEVEQIALAAAEQYVFKPGTVDGQPEEMPYAFYIHFRREH